MKTSARKKLGNTYYKIGMVLKQVGSQDSAINYFEKALDYSRSAQDYTKCIAALERLADIYDRRGNHYQATLCYGDCQEMQKRMQIYLALAG